MHDAVRVAESAAGLGVFAVRDLAEGVVAMGVAGSICSLADVAWRNLRHLQWLGGEKWMVLDLPARYVNHSCSPNSKIIAAAYANPTIVTTRPVRAGEEITIAYDIVATGEFDRDDPMSRFWHPDWTFDCRCGAPACRGRIDGRLIQRVEPDGRHWFERISNGEMSIGHDPAIEVRDIIGKGRGVFALRAFRPGETVERAPVIVIPEEQSKSDDPVLDDYFFAWGASLQEAALALGYGSLYNHSSRPNSRFVRRMDQRALHIIACRGISAGEEITILYNHFEEPIWFEVME